MTKQKIIDITTTKGANSTDFTIRYKAPRGRKEHVLKVSGHNSRAGAVNIINLTRRHGLYQAVCELNLDILAHDDWDSML